MAQRGVFDLAAAQAAGGLDPERASLLLEQRRRRRRLEEQVDAMERELQAATVAQESLRLAEEQAARQIAPAREELEHLRAHLAERMERARRVMEEFDAVKADIVELHRMRSVARTEAARLDDELAERATGRRRLRREWRDSSTDLADLRRALERVERGVGALLAQKRTGD